MNRSTRMALGLAALMALLLTGSYLPSSSRPKPTAIGRVIRAAAMHDRRADHTATLLPDGRVLVADGEPPGEIPSASEGPLPRKIYR